MITKQTTSTQEAAMTIEDLKNEKKAIEELILTAVQNPTENLSQVLFDLTNRHIEVEGAIKAAESDQN